MSTRLGIRLYLEFGRIPDYRGNEMNDWAGQAAAKIKAGRDQQTQDDAKFLEQQRIKKVFGNPKWLELREEVKKSCEDFNLQMNGEKILNFLVTPNSELRVRCDLGGQHRELWAAFDADCSMVEWSTPTHANRWELVSTNDGSATFASGPPMHYPITPAKIATQMLDKLLKG